ncbi:ATP-binding protein [Massilia sp. 9I]|uniref:ATP-binding protein n=1 Tax=Massilia sp. 9I TaxID=2653152 RepID=UPI0013570BBC|nr:ATP-binding protein [Massilia sp. 9I]
MSTHMQDGRSPLDAVMLASGLLGQELAASRVVYASLDTGNAAHKVCSDWLADQLDPSQEGALPDAACLELSALLAGGRATRVEDTAADPRTPVHAAAGLRAMLSVPMFRAGQISAALCVYAREPRAWSTLDVHKAQDVARCTWLALDAIRSERALRQSESLLQTVFDGLPVGIGLVDADGTMMLSNQEMKRYLPTGIMPSRDEQRHARWQFRNADGSLVDRKDYPGARALRGESVVPGHEALYRQDDGVETWTQVASVPIRDMAGNITGQVAVVTDIDRIKRAEIALAASEERYRTLFIQMDAAFCLVQMVFDEAGQACDFTFLETNPQFDSHLALSGAVGKRVRALIPGVESSWIALLGKVALTGEPVHVEKFSPALGRWLDLNASRVGAPGLAQVAVVFRDTTERRRIEEDVRRLAAEASEASRRKSEFLAVLAHELRNPMAPIRTGLEVMRMRPDSAETVNRVREMLERQTRQMTHLVDDLLDVARITSGKIEIRKQLADLNQLVSSAVETCAPAVQRARHELSVELHQGALLLHLDPTRIAQVIGNLLGNAVKYTPPGGRIRIEVTQEGSEAVVRVSDNGIGIPAESLQSVFEMFNQVGRNMGYAQGGLGIGLSLVKQLAALHEGSVAVASEGSGKGSVFTLRLPIVTAASENHVPTPGDGDAASHQQAFRVLIVDDNRDAAESLALLLELNKHAIRTAPNGLAALEIAQEFRPDVAFLDIGMPGMSGLELAGRLRSVDGLANMTIAAVTGWGAPEDQLRSKEAGFDHHFTKPISAEALSRLLNGLRAGGA